MSDETQSKAKKIGPASIIPFPCWLWRNSTAPHWQHYHGSKPPPGEWMADYSHWYPDQPTPPEPILVSAQNKPTDSELFDLAERFLGNIYAQVILPDGLWGKRMIICKGSSLRAALWRLRDEFIACGQHAEGKR